jgi:hypothetical protein
MPINIRLISYATICNVNIGEQRLRIQNRHPERLSLGRFPTLNSILIIFTNAIVCTLAAVIAAAPMSTAYDAQQVPQTQNV